MPTPHHPTAASRRALRKLGADIHEARLKRRLPMRILAERALTSRVTLQRVEQGDPAVSIGIYAAVLHALGLVERLGEVADPRHDTVGQALVELQLPKRARLRRPKPVDS